MISLHALNYGTQSQSQIGLLVVAQIVSCDDAVRCAAAASQCDASKVALQMSRGLGCQSGKGQTWSRFPGEACTRSHLSLVLKMQDHLARKMCRLDGRLS